MAAITVTVPTNKSEIGVPHPHNSEIYPFWADDTTVDYVGKVVYLNTTTKRAALADASAAGTAKVLGLCTSQIGRGISVLKRGFVGSEVDVTGMTAGAPVYASDTEGGLDTAAGTVSKIVGKAMPVSDGAYGTDCTLLLYVDVTWDFA